MNGLGIRILKSAVPSALMLALVGYLFAEMAGVWYDSHMTTPEHKSTATVDHLRSRLPLTMAAWGFGLVTLYELVRSLWRPRPEPKPAVAEPSVEEQLQKLLREAKAQNLAATPPPAGCPSPVGADNTAP
jgi:hypothetical protein